MVVSAIQLFVSDTKNTILHKIAAMEDVDLTEIYRLSVEDVRGASLCGQIPDDLNVEQLKRRLACRCA